jgi:hypothetical protein
MVQRQQYALALSQVALQRLTNRFERQKWFQPEKNPQHHHVEHALIADLTRQIAPRHSDNHNVRACRLTSRKRTVIDQQPAGHGQRLVLIQ